MRHLTRFILRSGMIALLLVIAIVLPASAQTNDIAVTAVMSADSTLKLISWGMQADGSVSRLGEADAGVIRYVSLTRLGTSNRIATAVVDSSSNLKIITWLVASNGTISRLQETSAGAVAQVEAISDREDRLYTAVRDSNGNLKIISWDIHPSGFINRLSDASAGAVAFTRMAMFGTNVSDTVLVTAVRDGEGNLRLISWGIDYFEGTITRLHDAVAGGIQDLAVESLSNSLMTTAVRNAEGNLQIILWEIGSNGTISRRSDVIHQRASQISSFVGLGGGFGTAMRDENGNLLILTWLINQSTYNITPAGSASAGAVGQVHVAACGDSGDFYTAVADSNVNLKVIRWTALPGMTPINRRGDGSGGRVNYMATVCL